jgi:hypothetical protein
MRTEKIPEILSRFKVGKKVKIDWQFDDYVSARDRFSYPAAGIVKEITGRGLFVQSSCGVISMVGVYDIASGTRVEVV